MDASLKVQKQHQNQMINAKRSLRVFLCHASEDKFAVKDLYERLVKDGIDAWFDKEKIIPGQNWKIEISRAVKNSDVVIICLSRQSITKEGFVQKEIKFALDIADEKPVGTIFIIPAKLEICDVPERISKFQWVDLFLDDGYERLLKALQIRAKSIDVVVLSRQHELIGYIVIKSNDYPNDHPERFEVIGDNLNLDESVTTTLAKVNIPPDYVDIFFENLTGQQTLIIQFNPIYYFTDRSDGHLKFRYSESGVEVPIRLNH